MIRLACVAYIIDLHSVCNLTKIHVLDATNKNDDAKCD